jgi:hypothetical protein
MMKPRKVTLGIDIAGAPGRQFDLALVNWENSEVFLGKNATWYKRGRLPFI